MKLKIWLSVPLDIVSHQRDICNGVRTGNGMAQSITCGYAISVILNGPKRYPGILPYDGIYSDFQDLFLGLANFQTCQEKYLKYKFKAYLDFLSKNKNRRKLNPLVKIEIIEKFSAARWRELSDEEKNQHSLVCKVRLCIMNNHTY